MVGCLQSGLRVLSKSFCNVEVQEDEEGNIIINRDGEPKLKTPNPCVELPYTYLMAHVPVFDVSGACVRGFLAFIQRLGCSS